MKRYGYPGSYADLENKRTGLNEWSLLRLRGRDVLSLAAQARLEWIIAYHTVFGKSATRTALHYGISRKTFHKYFKRFNERNLLSLEEYSRAPKRTRQRQISYLQRQRIKELRKAHMKWGKMKLQKVYTREYGETISSWKFQKVIEGDKLYLNKAVHDKQVKRRKQAQKNPKRRIGELVRENSIHHLWHVDTVIFTLVEGGYRYLLTAIDDVSKLAYARLYTTHSSRKAAEFLRRLHYLTEGEMINLHHDNGSEFKKDFEKACIQLSLPQWYSRVRTPKDNAVLERFNRTIQEEFVDITDVPLQDTQAFNTSLLEWLIEYNNVRPHQSLDYLTPLEYLDMYYTPKVLPMYSSSTPRLQ
jgi:transposase InsO family protein